MSRLLCLTLLLCGLGLAQPVARVQEITGARNLFISRAADRPANRWYRAHLEMDAELNDHFRTDDATLASLYFLLGGRANLDKGCELVVSSERGVDLIEVKRGTFWANFRKRTEGEKEIRIRTAGGVMAIRGTEVVVEVAANGQTILSTLEGEVEVFPDRGQAVSVKAGSVVTFGPLEALVEYVEDLEERLHAEYPSLADLRPSLLELKKVDQDLRDFQFRINDGEEAHSYNSRRFTYLVTGKDSGVSGGGGVGTSGAQARMARIDALLDRTKTKPESDSQDQEDADILAALLAGDADRANQGSPVLSTRPTLDWSWMEGERFAVLVLHGESEKLFWLDRTEGTSFLMPSDARPLEPGPYKFRVIPLDENNRPAGRAVESAFTVAP